MNRSTLVGLITVAVVATGMGCSIVLVAGAPGVPPDAVSGSSESSAALASMVGAESASVFEQEFDSESFEVVVHEDGSATWTFAYTIVLEDDAERSQFETFAERFENEETDLYERFLERADALTATGSEHTARDMAATNKQRSAEVVDGPNDRGLVDMSFVWTDFADEDDGRLLVSDVFDGGFIILDGQTLTFRPGSGLAFEHVDPDPDEFLGPDLVGAEAVHWKGEREFFSGHPYVVLAPEDEASSQDGGSDAGGSDGGDGGSDGTPGGTTVVIGAVVLSLVGVIALAWHRFGRTDDPDDVANRPTRIEPSGQSHQQEPEPSIPDEELLSDEDRVVSLIERNGGRMKQVNIVEETGWSKSKVSMLLSDMEDEGQISKLRVGRENIISLDGFEPEATKSPFED